MLEKGIIMLEEKTDVLIIGAGVAEKRARSASITAREMRSYKLRHKMFWTF